MPSWNLQSNAHCANPLSADSNLYEARAIVLSNMGQYKQALDIYVFKLKDPEKAEE